MEFQKKPVVYNYTTLLSNLRSVSPPWMLCHVREPVGVAPESGCAQPRTEGFLVSKRAGLAVWTPSNQPHSKTGT